MKNESRWSVIVITHDRPDFLSEALDSIAAQTLRPHEVIVVDDGSKVDIMPAAEGRPALPLTVIRQDNAGQQAARNTGAKAATGDWLVFLDDDDQFLPGHLEALNGALAQGSPDIIFTNFVRFEDGKDEDGSFYSRFPERFTAERLFAGCYEHLSRWRIEDQNELSIFYPSVMAVRRAHYEALGGFDRRIRGIKCEDMEFTTRATYRSPLALSLEPTVRYRMHEGNSVRDPMKREVGRLRIWIWLCEHLNLDQREKVYLDNLIEERAPHAFRAAFALKDAAAMARASAAMNWRDRMRPKRWLRALYARFSFAPNAERQR